MIGLEQTAAQGSKRWRLLLVSLVLSDPSSRNTTSAFSSTRPSSSIFGRPHHSLDSMSTSPLWMTQRRAIKSSNVEVGRKRNRSSVARRKERHRTRRKPTTGALQTWRIFGVNVHPDVLCDVPLSSYKNTATTTTTPSVDKLYLAPPVMRALCSRLRINQNDAERHFTDVRVIRRSLDARKTRRPGEEPGPRYTFVIDVDVTDQVAQQNRFRHQPGRMELLTNDECGAAATSRNAIVSTNSWSRDGSSEQGEGKQQQKKKPRIIIVGAGPAGLFCALTIARSGQAVPIVLERGQPVESRGRDIGALMHRRSLDSESNFAFGEGGAGTWSDGKLTTRIGRNSGAVRFVLETLVHYGAPETILVDGAPHLGTDNLVRLLRNMRHDLRALGGEIRFGAKMTNVVIEDGVVKGVEVQLRESVDRGRDGVEEASFPEQFKTETVLGEAVVLATGHSARDVYEELHAAGVRLEAKGFAVGFRVEHPQKLINKIQYDVEYGPSVVTGKGVTDRANLDYFNSMSDGPIKTHSGRLPVPSYRLATDKADDGSALRSVYSFCMCPGGQIVPSSTDAGHVCVNGMSFSKRDSLWANSALVVAVSPDDEILDKYRDKYGVLAGLEFQKEMEARASEMGGGNLTVPVQRLTDFVRGRASTSAPSSSYRLGVKPAACHEIYPFAIVNALRDAALNYFEKKMPGFVCEDALLHAVETRTSSPVRVPRDETYQAYGAEGLFPTGEGAGFAGGIVSAAVDGMIVAEAILEHVSAGDGFSGRISWKAQGSNSVGYNY